MNPLPDTLLAINAGPFERHYTTCRKKRFHHWKIHDGVINRSVSFIYGQVFKPSSSLNNEDAQLLPKNSLIQFCGTYRYIQLSEYIFEREQEVFITFFMSEYYVIHPFHYYTYDISFEKWMEKRSNWHKVKNFPDLRNVVTVHFRPLLQLLFSISLMDNKLKKIP